MTFGPLVVAERSIVSDGKGAKEYVFQFPLLGIFP